MTEWIKACGTNNCVEVMHVEHGTIMRSTSDLDEMITATRAEWDEFLAAVKAGKFDRPVGS